MIEVKIQLHPKQVEFLHSIEEFPNTFYGGAKGGGKSGGLRRIMLYRRFQYPGTSGVIFRKTLPELEKNHITPIFREFPMLEQYYNTSKKILKLPNKSTLEFTYCDKEKDLGRYQGSEWDDLAIEEAGEWPELWFRRLSGSNRTSKPGIKARTILTGNPGGIGHTWLKRLFVSRTFKEDERPGDYNFVQATVDDNPSLAVNDPDYIRKLESEPNLALRKAYRHGSWDIIAGQFFTEVRREVHLIKPFTIPNHWTRFGAYDFGFNHPGAFGWFANDEDGNVIMYREFVKAGLRVDQFAAELNRFDDTKILYPIVAGHDCWTQKNVMNGSSPPTIADEFKEHEILLKRATIDRIQGASQVRKYLAWQDLPSKRTKPRLLIFDTCPTTFECLTRMQHDPNRPEDVLKVDADNGNPDSGDDPYDMLRYGLMSKPMLSDAVPVKHKWGTKEWAAKETDEMEKAAEEYFTEQEALKVW